MRDSPQPRHLALAAILAATMPGACVGAENAPPPANGVPVPSSAAFCLFEVQAPPDRRLWVNLTIVQYIEQRPDELRIYYGGGNLGSGHELRVPLHSPDEAGAYLDKMRLAAARCAGRLNPQ